VPGPAREETCELARAPDRALDTPRLSDVKFGAIHRFIDKSVNGTEFPLARRKKRPPLHGVGTVHIAADDA
jgi:hypothetical protein